MRHGDAAHYHDWEFRSLLRIKLFDSKKDVESSSPKGDDTGRDRSALVNKIVEGLRGDAFLIARDLGLETLTQEGALEQLAERIKSHVFPRAQREAKELFQGRSKGRWGFYPDNRKSPC